MQRLPWLLVPLLPLLMGVAPRQWLAWEAATPISAYRLTVTPEGEAPQVSTLTGQSGPACSVIPDRTATTYCAPFACPQTGMFEVRLQALSDSAISEPAILQIGCLGEAGACTCAAATTPTPVAAQEEPAPGTEPSAAGSAPPPTTAPSASPSPAEPERPRPATLDPITTQGGHLVLTWHQPREGSPPPHRFLITYTKAELRHLIVFAVPAQEARACRQSAPGQGDRWCTRLACPGVGTWEFTVRPDNGTTTAPDSNAQSCTIAAGQAPCLCAEGGSTAPAGAQAPAAASSSTGNEITQLQSQIAALTAAVQALQMLIQQLLQAWQTGTTGETPAAATGLQPPAAQAP